MATTLALIIALTAFTATVVVLNTFKTGGEDIAVYNFDIKQAFDFISQHQYVTDLIPPAASPLEMVVAAIALVIPSIISFWIVSFIIK